ncbi:MULTISPECIES: MFS transporter [Pseudomonas]|uniref:MFS transporter n=1 Tax=Pseudomonas lini TaxID=163011 RepID=A0A1H2A2N8_9PSED|nr:MULTISPECIES: MFS transporter [Pseudomonas]KAB0507153.1 MFS transporter [Pseudomonas lini]MDT9673147.1 MFS transporter [Pseudomonas sp. JV414]NSX07339.1 MFS transporter [Pseudomonas lini]SDT40042.1 MFS transporter, CP family, cyanate transporter [Pseudomonas lini]
MDTSIASPQVNATAAQSWLLWAGFILVSLNLRLIFTTVGPLLENLQLGFTSTLLVTTLPLALLGIFSMAGVRLRQWLGEERALFFALILLSVGCSVRGLGEVGLIVGTIVGSAGIAVMNVIMPVLARKRFGPQRMGMVMGVYALMLGAGAVLGASASLPLFQLLGTDQASAFHSLGLWAVPASLALLLWLPQLRHAGPHRPSGGYTGLSVNVYRNPTAWAITLFFGLQVLNLFVFLPWMPTLLKDRGTSLTTAALIFSLSQLSLMVASFVTPLLAARTQDHRLYIASIILLCLAGTLGLMYAPLGSSVLWACLLGFGQGAGLSLGAFLFVGKASSIDTATRISAMAQTVGYLIAVAGPLVVGAIYQRTGDWNLPVQMLAGILLIELVVALPAGRNVKV